MIRGIPHDACDEEKLNDYFQFVEKSNWSYLIDLDISREAYPSFYLTHLTLAYNIGSLQHVYKRRYVFFCWSWLYFIDDGFSELNLRIWQQSKQMFEQSGKRPVVYNNKCGQMCGVSIKINYFFLIWLLIVLVLCQRSRFDEMKNKTWSVFFSLYLRSMLLNTMTNYIIPINNVSKMNTYMFEERNVA
jgi:hypothetical protein